VSDNLDLVRSIYADWGRGDFSCADWADPEMEFVFVDGPEPTSGRGRDAMWAAWHSVLEIWRDHRVTAEEHRELDGAQVLTLTAFSARGRTSGLDITEVQARGASLMQVRESHVTRLVLYYDRGRALADLGLEE
jgi:hypothetical protein